MARKILLADDSVTAQNMGRRILTEAGYEVITVNNGSAALKKIAEAKPDLIVLDVYMPGYGGLEVCQRLREATETARIPVLLTVGKLEPFKADEARRVRADAFIIKPFEASELLTALTKLEDKIVPHSQPYKPGRFAKAIAAAEESYGLGKEFGNPETGWKDRLTIPPHPVKPHQTEPEAPAGFRNFGRSEDHKPAASTSDREQTTPDLSQDIPARETIPAAFGAKSEETATTPLSGDLPESPAQEPVARTEETEEASSESAAVTEAEFAVASEQFAPGEPEISPYVSADSEPMPAATSVDSGANAASGEATQESGDLADDEVTAALASLAPVSGDWGRSAIGFAAEGVDRAPAWTNEQVLATMAATTAATPQFSGPRWIAEPVPVTEDESRLILEQEMAKAYAALAAADAARMGGDAWTPEPQTSGASTHGSNSQEPSSPEASMPESKMAVDISPDATAELIPPPNLWPYSSDTSRSQPEEETSAATPDPSAADLLAPNLAATNVPGTNVSVTNSEEFPPAPAELAESTESAVADAVSSPVLEVEQEAAFAAAASASASETITSESAPSVAEPGEHHHESELAAAWANWRQIRESVIGSEPASQVADAAAAGFREIRHEPAAPASEESSTETSDSTAEESTAIASIVDSVLADLKPKLMEEIARKMGKEPKKK